MDGNEKLDSGTSRLADEIRAEAGAYESMQGMEDAVFKNVTAITEYTKASRQMAKENTRRVEVLEGRIEQLQAELGEVRAMMVKVQAVLYKEGMF